MTKRRLYQTRRAVRRADEERFLPVFLSLMVLWGVAAGSATAYLRADDDRWYANSWTWFFGMLLTTLVIAAGLKSSARAWRPTVQMSVVLCLLVHLLLFVASVETNVFGRFWEDLVVAARQVEEREPLVEPDYQVFQSEEQQREQITAIDQPVEATAPDVPIEFVRPEPEREIPPEPSLDESEPEPVVEPNLLERREVERSVPRFSEQQTQLSRARAQIEPATVPPVELSEAAPNESTDPLEAASVANRARSMPQVSPPPFQLPDARDAGTPRVSRQARMAPPAHPESPTRRRNVTGAAPAAPETIRLDDSPEQPAEDPLSLAPADLEMTRPRAGATADNIDNLQQRAALRAPPRLSRSTGSPARRDQPDIATVGQDAPIRVRRSGPTSPDVPLNIDIGDSQPRESSARAAAPSGLTASDTTDRPAGRSGATISSELAAPPSDFGGRRAAAPQLPGRRQVDVPATALADGNGATNRSRGRRSLVPLNVDTAVPVPEDGSRRLAPMRNSREGNSVGDLSSLAASGEGRARRQTSGSIDLPAVRGVGGLQSGNQRNLGIPNRRASRDSDQLQLDDSRFRRRQLSGPPAPPARVVIPTEPFANRADRLKQGPESLDDEGRKTEEAIEKGLSFLARQQLPDGRWSLSGVDGSAMISSDAAATGLALLAFQGAGYNHREHRYATVVSRGIDFLVRSQQENGDLFVRADATSNQSAWLYSHGIAALALCEAHGMTLDPDLREPAQKSLDFIVAAQDPRGGGWRYAPGISSDSSVSGWMMMALKSGQLADLEVPDSALLLARRWFDFAQATGDEPHLYRYNPLAPDTPSQRHGRSPSPTMTAVGLLVRLYDGWKRDDASLQRGADYLVQHLPAHGTRSQPLRDTYYWYYGTQVMFHMRGEHWERWEHALRPLMLDSQIGEGPMSGSWDPRGPIPDRWAVHAGRLYVTAMNLLSLEVQYRYLPVYEETAR